MPPKFMAKTVLLVVF